MKKFFIMIFLIMFFIPSFPTPAGNDKPWEYSRTISGIKIYQRPGIIDDLFEFLAITTLEIPIVPIEKTILDIPTNRNWMADCIYSENIIRINSNEIIAYYVTAPPWPVSKRDSIIRIRTVNSSDMTTFTLSSLGKGEAEKYKSVNPDYIRIYKMEGTVTLQKSKQGFTEIKFSVAGESGGSVPGFIVRLGGWTIPYKTLSGLKKFLNSSL